ncbi:MAG: hypothetical protein A3J24_12115 [Deltaproteobacteria bacterium RIFCSPLOWO2_02_FULL_53_8]|nr:MAG: hypothetical protein A3J24_12115 [Deltaproteobacteria bacterium RIFCSPLOWO2_02_FULL_53_8]
MGEAKRTHLMLELSALDSICVFVKPVIPAIFKRESIFLNLAAKYGFRQRLPTETFDGRLWE